MRKQPALASLFSFCALAICCSPVVHAERLPVRRFTIADGLPSNSINCVVRDSHNFLWFCTSEGLSRFDGYAFVNYGVDRGLPDPLVTAFVESAGGDYWVGTPRGLLRFNAMPSEHDSMFAAFPLDSSKQTRHIGALLADRNGAVWAATDTGIYLLTNSKGRWVSRQVKFPNTDTGSEGPLMEDRAGNVWVVFGERALYRRAPTGKIEKLNDPFLRHLNRILSLFEDRDGRIWLGTYRGIGLIDHPRPGDPLVTRVYSKKDGLLDDVAGGVFQSSDGRLWAGAGGLYEILIGSDPKNVKFKLYGRQEEGFGGINAEDMQGNLWMASTRIASHGFVSYGRSDGLTPDDVRSMFEGHDGELYVITGTHSRFIHRFDGRRFTTVALDTLAYDSFDWFWGWGQIHFPDRNGEWWVATIRGLLRYPPVKRLEELAQKVPRLYTTRDGLPSNYLFRLYEDSRGDVWVGGWGSGLARWDRASNRFHAFNVGEGWLPNVPTAFMEDRSGDMWIGLWGHYLARYRNGRFTTFSQPNKVPDCIVVSLFLDHSGQLWIGTNRGGLLRLADPAADKPQFVAYTTQQGLSSNNVRAITEDHWGRIYFWTARGVDRLEPATGRIRHYTTADGLVPAGADNQEAFCDRQGRLWFGFMGLSRLDPEPDQPVPQSPPIRITGIRVRGIAYPVSELGETDLSGLVLRPNQNQLEIDFASLNFGLGEVLRYQYKLEGSGSDWSPRSELRTVNFAEVRPGIYRFLVRAINAEGVASAAPAALSFRVLAPVWQRWWFLGLLLLAVVCVVYALHRYRMAQLVTLERIRLRIASDLHDDIGAGLSQIAILSEVAKRDVKVNASRAEEMLDHVANVSRELVDSMSEIVWAISPRRDSLTALVQRMRRFGGDLLAPRDIQFDFRVLQSDRDLELRPGLSRHTFLIYKEAINNVARHANCTHVNASLSFDRREIVLAISDDGRGLRTHLADHGLEGHGLASMRRRAGEMDGHIEFISEGGAGTRIVLHVPLKRKTVFSSAHSMTT
jgi:ligand-binding sensor domain-containing protein/signal transduction histidine kinase